MLALIAQLGEVPSDIVEGLRQVFVGRGPSSGSRYDQLQAIARLMYNSRELHRRYIHLQELIGDLEKKVAAAGSGEVKDDQG